MKGMTKSSTVKSGDKYSGAMGGKSKGSMHNKSTIKKNTKDTTGNRWEG